MNEKVKAWLIPSDITKPLIPIGSTPRKLGYNGRRCDIVLNSISMDAIQAELLWQENELFVRTLSNNGLSSLNGSAVNDKPEPLYHKDVLSFAGQSFEVCRTDGKLRPASNYIISFVCDGELISKLELKKDDPINFPHMPREREEEKCVYELDCWTDEKGNPVTSGMPCCREMTVSAVYKIKPEGTMQLKGLLNLATYYVVYSEAIIRMGSSKQCDICVADIAGLSAKLNMLSGELKVLSGNCISVNGSAVNADETIYLYNEDILSVGSRSYKVSHMKQRPIGISAKLNMNDKVIFNIGPFFEGTEIALGRAMQKELSTFKIIGRNHASIRYKDGKFTICDNNSKNGTFICKDNKETALVPEQEYPLHSGDTISLASVNFVFTTE